MAKYVFEPNYAVPPGATLKETLELKGLSQADLALRTGLAEKTISQIVNGIAPISYETAEKLELVTGVPASFWNQREVRYREALTQDAEMEKLKTDIEWLKQVPVKVLVGRDFVEETSDRADLVRRVLKFFGVSSVASWRNTWPKPIAQFRGARAQYKYPGYVAAWLRMGERRAQDVKCAPFDARKFKKALVAVRDRTTEPVRAWKGEMEVSCAAAGVAVVFVEEIPRASVSGATRWLTKNKAILQLSLKGKTDDLLLFTFFHEAGHILLHGKKQMFLEESKSTPNAKEGKTEEEKEADMFARDILIPRNHAQQLPYLRSRMQIRQFARTIRVPPGVVVGRLQHDGLFQPSYCNDLKRTMKWSKK